MNKKKKTLSDLIEQEFPNDQILAAIKAGLEAKKSTREGMQPDHRTRKEYIALLIELKSASDGKRQKNEALQWKF